MLREGLAVWRPFYQEKWEVLELAVSDHDDIKFVLELEVFMVTPAGF